jgi:hypothetical protein
LPPTSDISLPVQQKYPLGTDKLQAITRALPPDRQHTVTVLAPSKSQVK